MEDDDSILFKNDVNIWPLPTRRKKCMGNLMVHKNCLEFVDYSNHSTKIAFTNIRHAIFQPCEKDISVLLHFQVYGKKSYGVQFFTEVFEKSQVLQAEVRQRSSLESTIRFRELEEETYEKQRRR